ncbi:MAG: hypothetical protein ACM3UU_01435 [Ignavibacteriales bacterium]
MLEEELLKIAEDIEKAKIDLHNLIQTAKQSYALPDQFILAEDKWKADFDGEIIKLYIPDWPPLVKNASAKNRWIYNTKKALVDLESVPVFKQAFVWLKIYYPDKIKDADADNRDIKSIIDGIRYAKLIKDDVMRSITYAIEPIGSQFPHTEVYIFETNMFLKVIGNITEYGK